MTEGVDTNDAKNDTKRRKKGGGGGNMNGFQSLGLSDEIYRGIAKMGFRNPTPVQRKSLPIILSGSDTVVMARTGSGKTAAFLIPLLQRLLTHFQNTLSTQSTSSNLHHNRHESALAVVLSPTRELSLQTLRVLQTLAQYIEEPTRVRSIGIHGGESMEAQFRAFGTRPHVICATPGRLSHHLAEVPDLNLANCDTLIFDEADRLFEMGFAMQIREICRSMPSGKQTMLFSATMPKQLVEFTKSGIMDGDPEVVRLDKDASVSEELRVGFVCVRSKEKDGALLHLLRDVLTLIKPTTGTANSTNDIATSDSKKKNDDNKSKKNKKKTYQKSKPTHNLGLTLIFAATRHHVDYLTTLINNAGISPNTPHNHHQTPIAGCIYGTMDQEARRSNLAYFRSGHQPILVVTDVAARGIDVPLIDHVIHYSFPPSAKLFVHRSGRAARAGRIGYCWGLVDAEEMPYMVDLYLFLGRKLSCGRSSSATEGADATNTNDNYNKADDDQLTSKTTQEDRYTLNDMTPSTVHYGSIPESTITEEVENVRRIVESELTGGHDAELLRSLVRVCDNASKQYRRSRPDASREGIRRAKAILEGIKESGTGKRLGGGRIPSHPVLRYVEMEKFYRTYGGGDVIDTDGGSTGNIDGGTGDKSKTTTTTTRRIKLESKLENLKKREQMLHAMANFRPKETIFEAFATRGGKATGVRSHIDNGRTSDCASQKKNDSSFAFAAMKSMRRQMKLAHQKGTSLVVAGSQTAMVLNGDELVPEGEEVEEGVVATSMASWGYSGSTATGGTMGVAVDDHTAASHTVPEKRRISKAERKRLKKQGTSHPPPTDNTTTTNLTLPIAGVTIQNPTTKQKTKKKRGSDFRSAAFYIPNINTENTEESKRDRRIEASMQPSSSNTGAKDSMTSALRLEEAMLDIVGDENMDLVKRHRMMRWDKSKRKYIQTTLGSELSGDSKSKKVRLESGALLKSDKCKLGEMYEKWQKKTNKSIGRVGVFDDVTVYDTDGLNSNGTITSGRTTKKNASKRMKAAAESVVVGDSGGIDNAAGEIKTATQIRKKREADKKMRLKNMKRSDKARLNKKRSMVRNEKIADGLENNKGWQGKKGFSGRYGVPIKGKR